MSAHGLATEAVAQLKIARDGNAPPTNNALAIDNTLSALSAYIPAEAMALYLAISSSLPEITKTFSIIDPEVVYWSFVWGISPGLFLIAYFAKIANSDLDFPTCFQFPWFRLAASILAFGVWGRCVPGNPFAPADSPGAGIAYGILAAVVSVVLPSSEAICNWLIRIYQKRQEAKRGGAQRNPATGE